MNRYLLDTHAWFWLVTGDARIAPPVVATLEAAFADGQVFLSQISTWEIAHKVSIGKIELSRPIGLWLHENTDGLVMIDLPLEIVVESTRLPGGFHKDPADRLIVATARVLDIVLVTRDKLILDYATGGHVKVAEI